MPPGPFRRARPVDDRDRGPGRRRAGLRGVAGSAGRLRGCGPGPGRRRARRGRRSLGPGSAARPGPRRPSRSRPRARPTVVALAGRGAGRVGEGERLVVGERLDGGGRPAIGAARPGPGARAAGSGGGRRSPRRRSGSGGPDSPRSAARGGDAPRRRRRCRTGPGPAAAADQPCIIDLARPSNPNGARLPDGTGGSRDRRPTTIVLSLSARPARRSIVGPLPGAPRSLILGAPGAARTPSAPSRPALRHESNLEPASACSRPSASPPPDGPPAAPGLGPGRRPGPYFVGQAIEVRVEVEGARGPADGRAAPARPTRRSAGSGGPGAAPAARFVVVPGGRAR